VRAVRPSSSAPPARVLNEIIWAPASLSFEISTHLPP
jgi:hypothetical protein